MQNVKAWLQDQKNMPIVIAGTVVIILLVVLRIMMTNGMIGGGSDTGALPTSPGAGVGPGGSSGGPSPIPNKTTTPAPGVPVTPAPGVGSTAAPTNVASSSAGTPTGEMMAPMLPYRKDPFSPLGGVPSPISLRVAALPFVQLPSFPRSGSIKRKKDVYSQIPAMEEPLPAQPLRRMAGVLMSGRISAIMETNGESDIVKPGMTITKGDSTVLVESIEPTAIILKTLDTRTPHRIRVNLTGAIEAAPVPRNP